MPEKPGHYINGFGEPCNTFGGPLDCPFGNPNCLHGVTPGGGYACHDFRKDGFPVYAKIPNSNDYVLVHVHRKCHMRGRCKWSPRIIVKGISIILILCSVPCVKDGIVLSVRMRNVLKWYVF